MEEIMLTIPQADHARVGLPSAAAERQAPKEAKTVRAPKPKPPGLLSRQQQLPDTLLI
jgi:hypothetical protein